MSTSTIARRRTRPNYTYAFLSVSLVLFLLGFFTLVLLHAKEIIQLYKEQVNIIVELEDQLTAGQIDSVQQLLGQQEGVIDSSIYYISKNEAARLMQEEFGEDFQNLGLPNPFYEMITFNVKAGSMQADSLAQLKAIISEFPGVGSVYYQESIIDEISTNLKKMGYFALIISLFFFIVAVTLVHNTIQLALYSNRFLIKNMQLVGASWGFISRPYLLRALAHGFMAGMVAIGALTALLFWVRKDIPQLLLVKDIKTFLYLLGLLIPLGMLLYGISTYQVVRKQLTMRVDDLY